jgi:hypothetical protein
MSLLFQSEVSVFNPLQKPAPGSPLQSTHLPQTPLQNESAPTPPYSSEELSRCITLEQLRQSRYSFNLSLVVIAISTAVSLIGAGLLMTGKTTAGATAAAGGILSTSYHLRLVKEANDRLEKSLMSLREEQ